MDVLVPDEQQPDVAETSTYRRSCIELKSAITALEVTLLDFVGKSGVHGEVVFPHTSARLASELERRE